MDDIPNSHTFKQSGPTEVREDREEQLSHLRLKREHALLLKIREQATAWLAAQTGRPDIGGKEPDTSLHGRRKLRGAWTLLHNVRSAHFYDDGWIMNWEGREIMETLSGHYNNLRDPP
jgi:hypothetical protein